MTASADGQAAGARIAERTGRAGRPGTRLIDGLWAATVLIALAGTILTAMAWSDLHPSDAYANLGSSAAAAAYATLGALIVRRVRNPVGWLLLSEERPGPHDSRFGLCRAGGHHASRRAAGG